MYTYRLTAGQEKIVAEMLAKRVEKEKLPIYSIALFEDLKGYLIVEAADEVTVRQAGMKIPHIRGLLSKSMELSALDSLIEAARPAVMSFGKGDIVELMSGPFKGEKAKIIRIDENRETVTVELTDVAVPIPVTIKADIIKIHQKAADVK
ncbi:MAG TPA: transcription elongation factor Spt5 [Candidatus Micrarchaeota archaeon]|nr:transcription elongation factor Spt5 [Candidatus Micrarchaeota archaeon]